ncbi:MAG: penicillin-binding protein 1C [Leptospiraceae bacterium]|nr:penicillin-binding protein 1C [Leptospiraceae bacterium]
MKFLLIAFFFPCFLYSSDIPTFEEVKQSYHKSDAVILDHKGRILQELRVENEFRRLDWIPYTELSATLLKSVIIAEDKRFYKHSGVDWIAVGEGVFRLLTFRGKRGASTITMQLASYLEPSLKPQKGGRTVFQKFSQIRYAKQLEEKWKKEEILEAYLNHITYRGELIGIDAASRGLFGKSPHGLNEAESLVLASLIKVPSQKPKRIAKRACHLATILNSYVDCDELKVLTENVLSRPYFVAYRYNLIPQIATKLKSKIQKDSMSLTTTLDRDLQAFATEVLNKHLLEIRGQNVRDGAVLIVENKTGKVLVYIAGSGELSSAKEMDAIRARRQAGSTLKPFVYGLAFENRLLTPASLLKDEPVNISVGTGMVYSPSNYQDNFHGIISARVALASSLNVPAVKVAKLVGEEKIVNTLMELGFKKLKDGEYYGLSIALGSPDITLWELVNAYRTFANKGVYGEMYYLKPQTSKPKRRVFSQEVSYIISDILSDRESRSPTFGLENPLSTKTWSAVKTGTSKDMRDNWCIGYNRLYTVGVWVGNFSGEPMWNVSGITGAAPTWVEVVSKLPNKLENDAIPHGIVVQKVEKGGKSFSKKELFLKGTEPNKITKKVKPAKHPPKIIYPVEGEILAFDPDIPITSQKAFLKSQTKSQNLYWILNGKKIGTASDLLPWTPQIGKYELLLVDTNQKILDKVHFEVR